MRVIDTDIEGVLIIEPAMFADARGDFHESYSARRYGELGLPSFVQDNVSRSSQRTLRGMHMQNPSCQAKLVSVTQGRVFDVAVDARVGSPSFGRWVGVTLDADSHRQLYVPAGFFHGFCVLSERAVFSYKCSDYYDKSAELSLSYADPDVGIEWPVKDPILSDKDRSAPRLREIPESRLLRYDPQ